MSREFTKAGRETKQALEDLRKHLKRIAVEAPHIQFRLAPLDGEWGLAVQMRCPKCETISDDIKLESGEAFILLVQSFFALHRHGESRAEVQ